MQIQPIDSQDVTALTNLFNKETFSDDFLYQK